MVHVFTRRVTSVRCISCSPSITLGCSIWLLFCTDFSDDSFAIVADDDSKIIVTGDTDFVGEEGGDTTGDLGMDNVDEANEDTKEVCKDFVEILLTSTTEGDGDFCTGKVFSCC